MWGRRPYPSWLIALVNAAGAALRGAGLPLVPLNEQTLLDTAMQETGLRDFGEDSYREPLRVLLRAYDTEAELTIVGRLAVRYDTLRLLTNRLRLMRDRQRHPAIAEQAIRQPWSIVGLPRSGSTLLHNLPAQDPDNRVPLCWEVMFPSPPPARTSPARDPRMAAVQQLLDRFDRLAPHFKRIHPMRADWPIECVAIMSHTFVSHQFLSMHTVPSYQKWLAAQDWRPIYAFHRQFLQHLQWRCPAVRWVLKAPSHLFALEALLAIYPDARIIQTHRDPLPVVASQASMDAVLRKAFSHRIDLRGLGPEALREWADGVERAMKVHYGDPSRFCDVYYTDLVREPMATVRQIYAAAGLRLTDEVEARMRGYMAAYPKDRHGVHRYSPAQFGLTPEAVATAFQDYLSQFRPEPEVTDLSEAVSSSSRLVGPSRSFGYKELSRA
jgi:Sulfotransferase family